MAARLRLADLLAGLSIASDLGFGLPPENAMRSCLVGTALARRVGASEDEVRDTFYATLLLHVGCGSLSHETAARYGDELKLMGAVARINVADPAQVQSKLVPLVTEGMDDAARAEMTSKLVDSGVEFGRRYDTGSCEVAGATARRLGLGEGTQRAVREMTEWWGGGWVPRGLQGEEIALSARIARAAGDATAVGRTGGAGDPGRERYLLTLKAARDPAAAPPLGPVSYTHLTLPTKA